MLTMILKMSLITAFYVVLTVFLWLRTRNRKLTGVDRIFIGVIYGICSILSTHFGVNYDTMIINIRDIGPLAAGLLFSPTSGLIAGFLGGIERFIAGQFFGIGSYTRIACSVSTCLAGIVAYVANKKIFKGDNPSPFFAFFIGAVMEVFHMYVVFFTHHNDLRMAFRVVSTCAIPMILFTGFGLSLSVGIIQAYTGEGVNLFKRAKNNDLTLSQKFHSWLFIVTSIVFIESFLFSFGLQTQSSRQFNAVSLKKANQNITIDYIDGHDNEAFDYSVVYCIANKYGDIIRGENKGSFLSEHDVKVFTSKTNEAFIGQFFGKKAMIYTNLLDDGTIVATAVYDEDMYWYRNAEAYEIALADILHFTIIYGLVAFLLNTIVVKNMHRINSSLAKITDGDLDEVVKVKNTQEFSSLSDDINLTVKALKGYIDVAEKRIEQELLLAKSIQASALPKVFNFPDRDEFELYASMKPAKEVGGDFYDFFFVDSGKLALVIADVSGKGIPASLFMMRSKTAIRSFAETGGTPQEILIKANRTLCEGNDTDTFVSVWIGIIDLETGVMQCANAGHEYPVIKHGDKDYEVFTDPHSLVLAAMPDVKVKQYELKLVPGDRLFVYTDGVLEAINSKEEQYGMNRLLDTLRNTEDKTINETLQIVSESLDLFKEKAEQFDDITMLGFEYKKVLHI